MYQPRQYGFSRVDWALIGKPDGSNWIRPRNFIDLPDPLAAYKAALWIRYNERTELAHAWFHSIEQAFPGVAGVAFLCWCPYDQAAQRQMREHGSFVCHTAVLGEWIENRLGHRVWFDHDRRHMKALP
jgi:hypothetical protein